MTYKLELKSSHEVVHTVYVADVESIFYCKPDDPDILTVLMKDGKRFYCDEVCPVDSLQKEPVSEDLKKAADNALESITDQYDIISVGSCLEMFRLGAEWQKTQEYACYEEAFEDGAKWKVENLWKPADGDDLPIIDREVIALLDNGKVVFAHRPPEYWDGKDIVTGKVTRNYPKTYDKGGWNIPNVKWWLDCSLPNMEED